MSGDPLADSMNGSMEIGVGTFALTDNRDNKDYLVRRLADGNCWMVQNLDLDLNEFVSTETKRLTPDNTDISETWIPDASVNAKIAQYIQEGKISTNTFQAFAEWQIGNNQSQQFQNYKLTGYNWGSRRRDDTATYSEIVGNTYVNNEYAEIPRSYDNTEYDTGKVRYIATDASTGLSYNQINSSNPADTSTETGWVVGAFSNYEDSLSTSTVGLTPKEKLTFPSETWNYYGSMYIGKYYNWYAATAETGTFAMGAGSADYAAASQASGSICPSGWELPYGYQYVAGREKSFVTLLYHSYGLSYDSGNSTGGDDDNSKSIREAPLSIGMTGHYNWGSSAQKPFSRGLQGTYVTRTAYGVDSIRHLSFGTSGRVSPEMSYTKPYGFSIRCVSHGTENQVTPPEDVVQTTCSANSICYDANGGTGDTMANTGSATFGSSKVLSAPTYTKAGAAFVGWSESKDAVQSGAYIYGPNETITVPNLSSEGMTLYAQWLAPENSSYTMQAFGRNETVKTCANMTDGNNGTTEERIALRDERDDNVYIVTKLKDGNCWMTSNLALNLADFAGKTTGTLLTPENTDLTASREDLSTLTIEGVGGGQTTVEYYDPAKSVREKIANGKVTNDPEETRTIADALDARNLTHDFAGYSELVLGQRQETQFQSLNQNTWYWGSIVSDDGNFSQTNAQYAIEVSQNANTEMPRSYNPGDNKTTGNYYNWYAATAEAGTYAMIGAQASDSICPSGWMLPSAYAGKDANNISYKSYYNLLHNDYNLSSHSIASSKILRSQPVSFSLPGYYNVVPGSGGSRIVAENSTSHYWSSSATNQDFTAYYTRVGSSSTDNNVFVASYPNGYKAFGFSIRCVKK